VTQNEFKNAFQELTGNPPFPWQQALFEQFISERDDNIPPSCNLPTGLGKTSVIAIWLLAWIHDPSRMPRRLVYVVNRRTVVDQTTTEVEKIRENLGKLKFPLKKPAISTLRGQFADNREWSADPSRPAVICGTVDMIGSRLLFSGYGVGYKGKPLHAGFLGQDVLLVHDEAHLEPAFQTLLEGIETQQNQFANERGRFRVMELSATSRAGTKLMGNVNSPTVFTLSDAELTPPSVPPKPPTDPIHFVWQRLQASKSLRFHPCKKGETDDAIRERIEPLLNSGKAILIFVRTIDLLNGVLAGLKKLKVPTDCMATLTGTMRGLERARLSDPRHEKGSRVFARFLHRPKSDAPNTEQWKIEPQLGTVFLVCTSAGEVGVDMSGDHLICDLTTLDSMMQRLGRVNRRGETESLVEVIYETDSDAKATSTAYEAARQQTRSLLESRLPLSGDDTSRNASPLALRQMNLTDDERAAGFAPMPIILPTTDILFDAWSLTSIRDRMPGRPHVEPYLHGIRDWEPPETQVASREEVGVIVGDLLEEYSPKDLLDEYPLKPHELLRDRTDRVWKELVKLAGRYPQSPIWIVDDQDQVDVRKLDDLVGLDKKQADDRLGGKTVLLPHDIGGLTIDGTLDGNYPPAPKSDEDPEKGNDVADVDPEGQRLRNRIWNDDAQFDSKSQGMRHILCIDLPQFEDDEDAAKRFWHWFEFPVPKDNSKNALHPVLLDNHVGDVLKRATEIVANLSLDDWIKNAILIAAQFHDLGKKRDLWQRSIGRPERLAAIWFGKSGKLERTLWKPRDITDYRHEFGSLLDLLDDKQDHGAEFDKLSDETKDLVQHLIAAHHGQARPHFTATQIIDPDSTTADCETLAVEVPRRFARLQRKFGRWGLAYLESILRAADWHASANPDPSGYFTEDAQ
jgi:CRISPR-associated endonuclease/helicase Cas3